MQDSLKIPHKTILTLFAAMVALAPIAVFNSYIFPESNLPFLLILLVAAAIAFEHGRIPKGIAFPGVVSSFLLFMLYAWVRLEDPWNVIVAPRFHGTGLPGYSYILDLAIFCLLFVVSAHLYYKRGKLWEFLWFLVCGYIIAYVVRNSFDIGGLQQGYNASPGFVLLPLLPLVFLRNPESKDAGLFIPTAFCLVCAIWLALIGARTAVASLVVFYVVFCAWPIIARNRLLYYGTFWGMILFVVLFYVLYLLYAVTTDPGDPLLDDALVEDSDVGIFQKRIGTRVQIWLHLLFLISQEPWFGYGTDHATSVLTPVPILRFTENRPNLSAHSTYLELLFRIGITGLLAYVLLLFSIWKAFWIGRNMLAVRVAGAFLLCVIFLCITGEYLVFSTLQLRSGFAWIVLGIGAGACLRAMKAARQRRPDSISDPLDALHPEPEPRKS